MSYKKRSAAGRPIAAAEDGRTPWCGECNNCGMRIIGAFAHGVIDYAIVIMLAIGPGVAGFRGKQAIWAYALAVVLFLLTVATRFPLGAAKVIGFPVHGAIELLIGILMIALPFIAGFSAGVNSRNFYIAVGVLIVIIFAMTNYRGTVRDTTRPSS